MKFSEMARSQFFWFLDTINGGSVKHHLLDIAGIMSNTNTPLVDVQLLERLHKILNHAVNQTIFYSDVNLENGITSFPVIDKNLIREKIDQFITSSCKKYDLIPAITSGSTGTPFKTYQSKDKKKRNTADTLYFAKLAGYELGNKLYYFKIWSQYNKKTSFIQKLQNIVPIDVLNLKKNVSTVLEELNKNQTSISLLGYVSAFETLCKELDKGTKFQFSGKINSIITMSEGLNDYTKQQGQLHFGCPVLSRYSNIENGIIAQQTLSNPDVFIINKASYLVEIMDLVEDKLVDNGQLGRIIITDYYNYSMPLIRYDTGDLGIKDLIEINGIKQEVLTRIEGRKLDQIYNTNGELISSYIVYKNMWAYTEIEQYQFVQKGEKEYIFKVCISGKFEKESQLIEEFKEYLGADANFQIEYVNEIPLLSSGKRKKVVNEMVIN